MRLVITDLTEFHNPDCYCVAGINPDGACFRPTKKYFSREECTTFPIFPGTILEGDFTLRSDNEAPHVEDCRRSGVRHAGICTAEEFLDVLREDASHSVAAGFEVEGPECPKCIPKTDPPGRSIITVRVRPKACWFNIGRDGKFRFSFYDGADARYSYLPIADLKMRQYQARHDGVVSVDAMSRFLHHQKEVFLRVGLGRCHRIDSREGYWLQVNGVYSFPAWFPETRGFAG